MALRTPRLSRFPGNPSKTPTNRRPRAAPVTPFAVTAGLWVQSSALSRAASGLGARTAAATLGLSPPGPGCPFRPASLPALAPRLALSTAWSTQRGCSEAGREPRAQGGSSPAHLAWSRPRGLTTPNRRAADSQPPSYHPTTADARAAGNLRSPRCRPLECARPRDGGPAVIGHAAALTSPRLPGLIGRLRGT